MTNVISLATRAPTHLGSARSAALTRSFAQARRVTEDVFWLKENAELLNIFEATGRLLTEEDLAPYQAFYDNAMDRMIFFPQYYRFLLSVVLDLEDLGMPGQIGTQLCDFVHQQTLVDAELSDLQRGEASRLLERRGLSTKYARSIESRLQLFICRSATFAVPNRKAAYELTHIIFYLTEYGRKHVSFSSEVEKSLIFTGIMSLLEDNYDLLAEVCVALRFAGFVPPAAWEDALEHVRASFQIQGGQDGHGDDYHTYLMINWAQATAQRPAFRNAYSANGLAFYQGVEPLGTLRSLSYVLYNLSDSRTPDWSRMKGKVLAQLGGAIADHVRFVAGTTDHFDAFFALFARAVPGARAGATLEGL